KGGDPSNGSSTQEGGLEEGLAQEGRNEEGRTEEGPPQVGLSRLSATWAFFREGLGPRPAEAGRGFLRLGPAKAGVLPVGAGARRPWALHGGASTGRRRPRAGSGGAEAPIRAGPGGSPGGLSLAGALP